MRYFKDKDVRVKLNGTGVKGASSFSASSSYARFPINILGGGYIGQNYVGRHQGNGTVSANILDAESTLYNFFFNNSGIIPSGVMGAEDVNFSFNSGYINQYSAQGGVNSFHEDSISFDFYHEIQNLEGISEQDNIGSSGIRSSDVILSGDSLFSTEHIQSYGYSVSTNWQPNYIAGSHFPIEVSNTDGYTVNLSINLVSSQSGVRKILNDFARATGNGSDLAVIIGSNCFETPLTLKVPKAHVVEDSMNSSVGSFLGGDVNFVGFTNNLEDLK